MSFDSVPASLFLNHDLNKIQVDNPIALNLSLFFGFAFLSLIFIRKTVGDQHFSVLHTNQTKGLAIIAIIVHHLRIHTIKNASDLLFIYDFGITGVAVFLILSGFGISTSLKKKGTKSFFSKRLIRLYVPYVSAMILEVFLNHVLLHNKSNIFIDIGKIILGFGIDRNMWFIVFVLLWYCMIYIAFQLDLSNFSKLFLLFFVSLIIIITIPPQVGVAWKINAFSFPLGCCLGLNSKFIKKLDSLVSRNNVTLCGIIILCFLLAQGIYFIANESLEYPYLGAALILGIFCILGILYLIKTKIHLANFVESICLFITFTIISFHYLGFIFKPIIIANTFFSIYAILSAVTIIFIISLLTNLSVYSHFLSFIGEISFELYLLHGMFMYSFDFILFRGNIAVTFFIYFIAICIASIGLRKFSSVVSDLLVEKLKV
jgi:peptidoglycan/LPS O-acetylase OafA/YrhL